MVNHISNSGSSLPSLPSGPSPREQTAGKQHGQPTASQEPAGQQTDERLDLSRTGELFSKGTGTENKMPLELKGQEQARDLAARIGRQISESGRGALLAQAGSGVRQLGSLLYSPPG